MWEELGGGGGSGEPQTIGTIVGRWKETFAELLTGTNTSSVEDTGDIV